MADKNDKPVVNFVALQSVEDYVEKSGKFRTECASFKIPGRDSGGAKALYIPYCEKQRFDFGHLLNDYRGNGVFTPPETGKRWQMTDFVLYREHFPDIHCPRPCAGYSGKKDAAKIGKPAPQVSKGETVGSTADGKWTRKEIVNAVVVPVVVAVVAALLGWLTPEGRLLLHLDKSQPEQQSSNPSVSITKPETNSVSPPSALSENHKTSDKVTAVVKPSSIVDWHDKHNWRKYLHTEMTRTEVRKLFGEPEKMRVFDILETWDYGSGSITFSVESGSPDGSLYSWDEPH